MISRSMSIRVPKEQEVRLAAILVQIASRYESSVHIQSHEKKVNAKSIMGMMSLSLRPGDEVTVFADGADEEKAIDDIGKFLENS